MDTTIPKIALIDLAAQQARLGDRIDKAIRRVLDHGAYILGPEVAQLEADLKAFSGAAEVVTCSNGTDALMLVLLAKNVGPGDSVICPSFTFAATAEVVAAVGATPILVDIREDTFNLDPEGIRPGLAVARSAGLRPVGIIPVDLFGQPADYDPILSIAEEEDLWVMCDAAQAFGATYRGQAVGTIGLATAVSFFPAKPLGCYGDGGAIFTDDAELAATIRSLRAHGRGSEKYDNVIIGRNARLDTVQAAVLLEKLKIFPEEIEARQRVADRYAAGLGSVCTVPDVVAGGTSVWAQYTVRFPGLDRNTIAKRLKERGVPTAVYYPKPLHRQPAYQDFPVAGNGLPVSDRASMEVLSLPMHPYLEEEVQAMIVKTVMEVASA